MALIEKKITNYYPSMLEIADYNPDEDIIAIFVGTEDDIPPQEIFQEIADVLEDLPNCKILVMPGIFRLLLLKGVNKNGK